MLPQKNELKFTLVVFVLGIAAGMLIMHGLQDGADTSQTRTDKTNSAFPSDNAIDTNGQIYTNTAHDDKQKLLDQIREVVQLTVSQELQRHSPNSENVSNTENQTRAHKQQTDKATYQELVQRIKDPTFNQTLTMDKLLAMPEVQGMPREMRERLLSETAIMLSRGELDPRQFLTANP